MTWSVCWGRDRVFRRAELRHFQFNRLVGIDRPNERPSTKLNGRDRSAKRRQNSEVAAEAAGVWCYQLNA